MSREKSLTARRRAMARSGATSTVRIKSVKSFPVPLAPVRDRLALTIAESLADEILQSGWPVGRRLGNEAELMKRFGASRESFREGVRVLEFQGLVRVERGARGGLIIEAPAYQATAAQLRTYLGLNDISADEILSAQTEIHQFVGPRSARSATPSQIVELRNEIAKAAVALRNDPSSVGPYLAINQLMHRSSGHAVAGVFSDALILSRYGFVDPKIAASDEDMLASHRQNLHYLSQMVEAFAAHDLEALVNIQRRMIDQIRRRLDRIQQEHPRAVSFRSLLSGRYRSAMGDIDGPQKSSIKLAYSIAARIRREQMQVGAFIGSQKSLMQEGGISAAVFREATCLLEYFGVVEVRQGPHGGLFVSLPNPRHTIAAAARYLRYLKIAPGQSDEFRRHVMRSIVRQVADRMSVDDVMHVRSTVAACGIPVSKEHLLNQAYEIRRSILDRSANRAMRLIAEIMLALQPPPVGRFTEAGARSIGSERELTLKAISEAYLRSDAAGLERSLMELVDLNYF